MTPEDSSPDPTREGSNDVDVVATADRLRATLRDVAAAAPVTSGSPAASNEGLRRLRVDVGADHERTVAGSDPTATPPPEATAAPDDPPTRSTVIELGEAREGSRAILRRIAPIAAAIVLIVGFGVLLLMTFDGGSTSENDASSSPGSDVADPGGQASTNGGQSTEPVTPPATTIDPEPVEPTDDPSGPTDPADSRTTLVDPLVPTGQFDDLDGLTFVLVVDSGQVMAGEAVGARLRITNTTDEPRTIHECTGILISIGFVAADQPAAPIPPTLVTDCYRTPYLTIGAGATEEVAFEPHSYPSLTARGWDDDPFPTHPLGALSPGSYLATVDVPGSDGTVRVQVPVTITEPMCDGLTDDLVRAVRNLDERDARAAARDLGFDLRVARIDGFSQALTEDLRCDRVNVSISDGRVYEVVGVF